MPFSLPLARSLPPPPPTRLIPQVTSLSTSHQAVAHELSRDLPGPIPAAIPAESLAKTAFCLSCGALVGAPAVPSRAPISPRPPTSPLHSQTGGQGQSKLPRTDAYSDAHSDATATWPSPKDGAWRPSAVGLLTADELRLARPPRPPRPPANPPGSTPRSPSPRGVTHESSRPRSTIHESRPRSTGPESWSGLEERAAEARRVLFDTSSQLVCQGSCQGAANSVPPLRPLSGRKPLLVPCAASSASRAADSTEAIDRRCTSTPEIRPSRHKQLAELSVPPRGVGATWADVQSSNGG